MPNFTIVNKLDTDKLSYNVNGIPVENASLSCESTTSIWTFSFTDTKGLKIERQFDSLILALTAIGATYHCTFQTDQPTTASLVNTMIQNLSIYQNKKSDNIPGEEKKKATRDIRADLQDINSKMSLILKPRADGIESLHFRVRESGQLHEKTTPVSMLKILSNKWSVLVQEAKKNLKTDKSTLGLLKDCSSIQQQLQFALSKTKGHSAETRAILYDEILLFIADEPRFAPSIKERLTIYNVSSIQQLLATNEEYRSTVKKIKEDKTGINVILNKPDEEIPFDFLKPLLKSWVECMPNEIAQAPEHSAQAASMPLESLLLLLMSQNRNPDPFSFLFRDRQQPLPPSHQTQRETHLHRQQLEVIPQKLKIAIHNGMPNKIQILFNQRRRAHGNNMLIEAKLLSLTDVAAEAIKDQLLAMMASDEGAMWVQILQKLDLKKLVKDILAYRFKLDSPPYFTDNPDIQPPELLDITNVIHYLFRMLQIKQTQLEDDYYSRLNTIYDDADIECTADTVRQFKPHEVKDPVTRHTLNTQTIIDATWYERLLIGGIYSAHDKTEEEIDKDIQLFVEEQTDNDEHYLDKAKDAYYTYMSGLSDFKLHPRLRDSLKAFSIDPSLYGHAMPQARNIAAWFHTLTQPGTDRTQPLPQNDAERNDCVMM